MSNRRTPYTERGIRRVPCYKCGQPSRYQWQVCADGNVWRGLCAACDIALNRLVLRWFGKPGWQRVIHHYKEERT